MSTRTDQWLPPRRGKDKHGRPELLMNPAIKKGITQMRPATPEDVDRDRRPEETSSQ